MTEQEALNKATEGLSDSDAVAAQFGWCAALKWARTQQEPALRFPQALRKMWSGGEVQQWLERQGPLYAAPVAPTVPKGWKLVPEEPTREMLREIRLIPKFTDVAMEVRYRAMLAATPEYKEGE